MPLVPVVSDTRAGRTGRAWCNASGPHEPWRRDGGLAGARTYGMCAAADELAARRERRAGGVHNWSLEVAATAIASGIVPMRPDSASCPTGRGRARLAAGHMRAGARCGAGHNGPWPWGVGGPWHVDCGRAHAGIERRSGGQQLASWGGDDGGKLRLFRCGLRRRSWPQHHSSIIVALAGLSSLHHCCSPASLSTGRVSRTPCLSYGVRS